MFWLIKLTSLREDISTSEAQRKSPVPDTSPPPSSVLLHTGFTPRLHLVVVATILPRTKPLGIKSKQRKVCFPANTPGNASCVPWAVTEQHAHL